MNELAKLNGLGWFVTKCHCQVLDLQVELGEGPSLQRRGGGVTLTASVLDAMIRSESESRSLRFRLGEPQGPAHMP